MKWQQIFLLFATFSSIIATLFYTLNVQSHAGHAVVLCKVPELVGVAWDNFDAASNWNRKKILQFLGLASDKTPANIQKFKVSKAFFGLPFLEHLGYMF